MFQPCWSDQPNTLTQEIPPTKKPAQIPHLALPTCSHTACILYQAVKLSPQMLRPPVLIQLSTVMDMTSAWPTGYTNALFVPLPDVLLPWKLTSHIPLTLGLLIDGAQLVTWTAKKSVLNLSSHRNQTLFITGNSISFTNVTPGLPTNSNNHIILQKINNTQSCNTTDNKFTYPTRVFERMDTRDVNLSANPLYLHCIPPLCKQQQQTKNANPDVEQ